MSVPGQSRPGPASGKSDNVRYAPSSDQILQPSEMTRWARSGNAKPQRNERVLREEACDVTPRKVNQFGSKAHFLRLAISLFVPIGFRDEFD